MGGKVITETKCKCINDPNHEKYYLAFFSFRLLQFPVFGKTHQVRHIFSTRSCKLIKYKWKYFLFHRLLVKI